MTKTTLIKLNSNYHIPQFGFGTWQLLGNDAIVATQAALNYGYIHIDTAQIYNNEYQIGQVLKKYNREKIFITTKVWVSNFKNYVEESVNQSLKRLGVEYLDLILLHFPYRKDFSINVKAYKNLMKLREEKLVRSIGVSNYSIEDLKLLYKEVGEWPAVNQIVFGPTIQNTGLIAFCNKHKIVIEGYSLMRVLFGGFLYMKKISKLTKKEELYINKIAKKYKKTPSQILIRWALQLGIVIFPKSRNINRIKENANVFDFEISKSEIMMINKMARINTDKYEAGVLSLIKEDFEKGLLYEYNFKG